MEFFVTEYHALGWDKEATIMRQQLSEILEQITVDKALTKQRSNVYALKPVAFEAVPKSQEEKADYVDEANKQGSESK